MRFKKPFMFPSKEILQLEHTSLLREKQQALQNDLPSKFLPPRRRKTNSQGKSIKSLGGGSITPTAWTEETREGTSPSQS
jgi:hypothetical protein